MLAEKMLRAILTVITRQFLIKRIRFLIASLFLLLGIWGIYSFAPGKDLLFTNGPVRTVKIVRPQFP